MGVALVTGGARGIGRGIAIRLAADGHDVAVADLPSMRSETDATAAEIGGLALDVDVSDAGQVDAMIAACVAHFGRLDIMVANAGIAQVAPLLEVSPEQFDKLMAVNLRGVFLCYTAAARQMISQGDGGKIIGAASIAAHKGFGLLGHYSASKFAVRGLTQAAAQEWAEHGITVNAYCPGIVGTAMWELIDEKLTDMSGEPTGSALKKFSELITLGRVETPEDVASFVSYLSGADSDYMTGQSVMIDGGVLFGMKAAVFHGPHDIRLEDVAEPTVRPGSVKVKVDWCGICGTDLHEYLAGPIFIPPVGSPHPITGETLPLTLGHEFAGSVVEVASDVGDVAVGDSVAIEPVYRCGACPACRRGATNLCEQLGFFGLMGGGGGMSEYAVMPSYMIHRLPGELSAEQGALVEPIAVGLRAVRRAGFVAGQSAAVFGAGPIGAVTMQCLKALGAGQIIAVEVAETRKRKALELGADVVIDPSEEDAVARIRSLTDGEGVEHSFDAAGLEVTLRTALAATRKGGTVTIISIWEGPVSINPNDIVLSELNVLGTICYTPEDFADTIGMIRDGSIVTDGMITERIALDDVVAGGFDELVSHKDRHVKILVRSAQD